MFETRLDDFRTINKWISERHYLQRRSLPILKSIAYGFYVDDKLVGGCVWSAPQFNITNLYTKLERWSTLVLTRFYLIDDSGLIPSQCLAECIGRASRAGFRKKGWRIQEDWVNTYPPIFTSDPFVPRLLISYSDPSVGHSGTIYKASGFELYDSAAGECNQKSLWTMRLAENKKVDLRGKTLNKNLGLCGIIYLMTFPNKKKYVGQTTRKLIQRMRQHKHDGLKLKRESRICRAIKKYGWENTIVEILASTTYSERYNSWEKKCIERLKPEYNIAKGGEDGNFGYSHSEEAIKKMSLARRGRKPTPETIEKVAHAHRGKPRTPETREKIRQARIGTKRSPETREKLRQVTLKTWNDSEFRKKIGSPEHKEKLSRIRSKVWSDPEVREKIILAQRKRLQDPAIRERMRLSQRKRWQDPVYREKISLALRERCKDSAVREKMSNSAIKWWAKRKSMSDKT